MPNAQPMKRDELVGRVYESKQELIKQTAEALGPPAGAQKLTAEEIARGWGLRDFAADPDQVWIEELAKVVKAFPSMTLGEAMDEARPEVGKRLFRYRDDLAGGDGRGALEEKARWARGMSERIGASPESTLAPLEVLPSTAPPTSPYAPPTAAAPPAPALPTAPAVPAVPNIGTTTPAAGPPSPGTNGRTNGYG